VRQREGRCDDAIALCHRAIDEAEACGEDGALAHACFILDWALFDAGRPEEARHSPRALEIYERLGEVDREAAVLNNMGGFAYHEGRWDDAVELYRRSARASERAGDQGELDEADAHLRRALRIWRGSGYDWGTAFATALLGRTAVRAGRTADGAELLDAALCDLRELRAMADLALVQAYRAEAHAFAGEPESALRAVAALLPDAGRTAPLLHRVRGFALAQAGDEAGAEQALETAIVEARARGMDYELAVSLHALQALHDLLPDRGAGRRLLLDVLLRRLHVVALPAPPLVRGPTALTGVSTT
jgi:tetratricopeptide (TPR) repeat protein